MKPARLFLTFSLPVILWVSACAPAAPSPTPAPTPASPTPIRAAPLPTDMAATSAADLAPTQAAPPIATSRGPELHASDPATVMLASGQLQLIEFFRFT
ncbi:MAG: hypothetical protein HFACDABA_01192 [Anaerolineales bacterium]|nr:hypothetical protein [Anaerolineales bacterium]